MQLLGHEISQYDIALISAEKKTITEQQENAQKASERKLSEKNTQTPKTKKGILSRLFGEKGTD